VAVYQRVYKNDVVMTVISNFPAQGKVAVAVFAHDEGFFRGTSLVIPPRVWSSQVTSVESFQQIHPLNQFTCIV